MQQQNNFLRIQKNNVRMLHHTYVYIDNIIAGFTLVMNIFFKQLNSAYNFFHQTKGTHLMQFTKKNNFTLALAMIGIMLSTATSRASQSAANSVTPPAAKTNYAAYAVLVPLVISLWQHWMHFHSTAKIVTM